MSNFIAENWPELPNDSAKSTDIGLSFRYRMSSQVCYEILSQRGHVPGRLATECGPRRVTMGSRGELTGQVFLGRTKLCKT